MLASSLIPAAMRKRMLAALLPQDCLMCGAAESPTASAQDHSSLLCDACRADLPWLPRPSRPVCALPTSGAAVCGRCIANPPQFDATRAALAYRYPVEPLMQ